MMHERLIMKYLVFIFILIINYCLADNTKLKDVLRINSSKRSNNGNNTNKYNSDEDVLQTEVTKILDECSSTNNKNKDDKNRYLENGDSSDTYRRITNNGNYYKNVGYGDNDDRHNNHNSRNNPNSNGNSNSRNNGNIYNDYNDNPYSSNARSNYSSSNGGNSGSDFDYNSNNNPYSSNSNNGRSGYGFDNNNNRNRNYNDYGSSRLNNMQSNRYNSDRNNNDQELNYESRNRGYTYTYETAGSDNMGDSNVRSSQSEAIYGNNGEYSNSNKHGYNDGRNEDTYSYGRRKRSNNNSKNNNNNQRISDNQCTSQCVFNSMELLDDDDIPSETLMIKWIQEHINDDDMKRIKSLREIRKCFTRLSTSDIDDGCEYSNDLAKCLNLEID